jgi:glycosyltransferase involved in cell wall biosynthesis
VSRITFLLSQSLDSPSGLGRYGPLAKGLVKLGHHVEIIALHPAFDELDSKDVIFNGIPVHYVSQMHVKKSGDSKTYFSNTQLLKITWLATWQLSKGILASKSDIVLVGKPHPMNSIAGLISKYINRSTLLLDCDDFEAASGRFGSSWQRSIISWFEKWMPSRATFVTTNTYFMRDKLIKWGVAEQKIVYLPNGIDEDRFTHPDPEIINSLRQELGLEHSAVVGFIGSLSLTSHPVNLLLEAMKDLIDRDENVILLLVGGGEDIQSLKDHAINLGISQQVKFTGRVDPESVPLYYSLTDVSVDPVFDDDSARGRSPLKLFESWVCGVPFVCGDVGDRRSLLGDPPAGILSQPGNPEALAEAIRSVIINKGLADELRQRGYERLSNFTWDHLVSTFGNQILDRIIKSPT